MQYRKCDVFYVYRPANAIFKAFSREKCFFSQEIEQLHKDRLGTRFRHLLELSHRVCSKNGVGKKEECTLGTLTLCLILCGPLCN